MIHNKQTMRSTVALLSLYATAMGFLEAAVVVYLRRIYYPDGFRFPLVVPIDSLARIEVAREAATLVMILAVALLAGRKGWDRFAAFMYVFGLWDIVYYAGLRITLGWPESLATWDILFLIPAPWVAPIWAPALIALLLMASALAIWRLLEQGAVPRVGIGTWAVLVVSGLFVIASFLADAEAARTGRMPGGFAWPPFLLGVCAALAVALRAYRSSLRRPGGS